MHQHKLTNLQETDISGSKDGLLAVDERLAKLMLGNISLIQSYTFKSKSEIECGMCDIFKKAFGHDWIGSVAKKFDKASGVQSNSTGNRSQDEGKSRSRSSDTKGKEMSTKQSGVGELMGPPQSVLIRSHGGGKHAKKTNTE